MYYFARRERLNSAIALGISLVLFLLYAAIIFIGFVTLQARITGIMLGIGICWLTYRFMTRRYRHRRKLLKKPFPQSWEQILDQDVRYYQHLSQEQQKQFRDRLRVFLDETVVHGVDTEVTDRDRVLVAASALIPVAAFPDWEYDNVREVLLYSGTYDMNFDTGPSRNPFQAIEGMVGNRALTGVVTLSKPAMLQAYSGEVSERNVAIHEFIHMIDGADGSIDGIPDILVDQPFTIPWIKVIQREMNRIRSGESDLNEYALTNEQEFFAVASEYFFDDPEKFQENHPRLYRLFCRMFRQDLYGLYRDAAKDCIQHTGNTGKTSVQHN